MANVRVTGVTSTQAVVGYTASDTSACTVEVCGGSGYRLAGMKVTAARNASPIAITTDVQHTLASTDKVSISGVGGNTAGNGYWSIPVTGTSTFTLDAPVGNGAYTSGGTVAVVVQDVNTRLFAGSDQDSRAGSLSQGRARTVVLGARTAQKPGAPSRHDALLPDCARIGCGGGELPYPERPGSHRGGMTSNAERLDPADYLPSYNWYIARAS
jgi:hypothetical protein